MEDSMADDPELSVSFTADTSELEAGAETAKGVIETFSALVAQTALLADQLAAIQAKTAAAQSQAVAGAAQANQKISAGNRSAAEGYAQVWSKTVTSVVDTFGNGLLGMARGTQTFHATALKVAESVEDVFVKAIEKTVVTHVLGETTKSAATAAGQGTQTAATAAGVAARTATEQAGQSESLALDLTTTLKKITNAAAAAAAAATFVAVEGFGALASASGGYDIGDENPMVQAHAREMILPASIAEPLRGMIAAGGAERAGSGDSSGSGAATHQWNIQALDSRSFARTLNTSAGRGAVRNAAAAHAGRQG
jgi:uncharacterized phage infection (PIP) family protein YhgE